MASDLRDPLLDHPLDPAPMDPARERGRDFADKVFDEFGASRYQRQHSLTRERERQAEEEREWGAWAVAPLYRCAWLVREELGDLTLPVKAGIAASLCSLLCYVPGYLNKNGLWAVLTADLVLEHTVGQTLIRGINRTTGTMAAAAVALVVNYAAHRFAEWEPYIVAVSVFLGAVVATMFKFRRPFKDRWNYAVAMSLITFHILILTKNEYKDKIRMPFIRIVDIAVGFVVASLVAIVVYPTYAGSTINDLLGRNFERAGNVMERCVDAYCDGAVLEQVHELLHSNGEDNDNIFLAFHEIVSADSEVDKLLKTVRYEPPHGRFFAGYPWDMYRDIAEHLRYTLYDVLALDSCLRGEIQAPMHLRQMFEDDLRVIGSNCGQLFRLIGSSIREMRHVRFGEARRRAEEGALLLQHKVAKYTTILLLGYESDKQELRERYNLDADGEQDSPGSPRSTPTTPRTTKKRSLLAEGHEAFMQRQGSLGRHRQDTVQRISNLSLIKFAALLIELLAKAKYMVSLVDELENRGRFDEAVPLDEGSRGGVSFKRGHLHEDPV